MFAPSPSRVTRHALRLVMLAFSFAGSPEPARAVRHVGARLRRRLRDRQPDRHPHQSRRPTRPRSRARPPRSASTSRSARSTGLPRDAFAGELGKSFVSNVPAVQLILERMPATIELALDRHGDRDRARHSARAVGGAEAGLAAAAIMAGSILGFSLPTFWVGLMLIMVFSVLARLAAADRARANGRRAGHAGELSYLGRARHLSHAGAQPRALQARAPHPADARRHARGDGAGLRAVRARQGPFHASASCACTC